MVLWVCICGIAQGTIARPRSLFEVRITCWTEVNVCAERIQYVYLYLSLYQHMYSSSFGSKWVVIWYCCENKNSFAVFCQYLNQKHTQISLQPQRKDVTTPYNSSNTYYFLKHVSKPSVKPHTTPTFGPHFRPQRNTWKNIRISVTRASAKVPVTPNPSVWAMQSLHSTWSLTRPCHVYICALYETWPSQTSNTRTQLIVFLWASGQQEGQYCSRAGDKACFS